MLVLTSLLAVSVQAYADIDVIVNSGYALSHASKADIAKVFLAKANALPGGSFLVPVDQRDGAPARSSFYAQVTGKNASQLNAYWSKLIFTGQGQPPRTLGGDDEIAALVAKNPNMIGYVHASATRLNGLKVIAHLPE